VPEALLIVGLGNPEKSTKNTDTMRASSRCNGLQNSWAPLHLQRTKEESIQKPLSRALKMRSSCTGPLEFMNLSGGGVRDFSKKHSITLARTVVLHDEIELPFGEVKWKTGGGHKGHNGLRDIIAKCGGPDFHRVRLGVGRPDHDDVADYVLSNFTPDEQAHLPDMFARSMPLIQDWVTKSSGK
jgi:PTH1 family peptidyl-tRNA hydrolase